MNVSSLIGHAAQTFGNQPMIVMDDRVLCFSDIEYLSQRFAANLLKLGLKKGDRVTVGLPNSPEMVVAFFAVLRMGGIVVPLNPLMKEKELGYIFKDSEAKAAITFDEHLTIIRSLGARCGNTPDQYILLNTEEEVGNDNGIFSYDHMVSGETGEIDDLSGVSSYDLALICYTSGTTGTSKGVMLSHHNLISVAKAVVSAQHLDNTDSIVCFFPLTHITGIVNFLFVSLVAGETVILQDHFDCDDYLKNFQKYGCTTIGAVAAVFQAILNHREFSRVDFSSLKRITSGGTSLPEEMYRKLTETFRVPVLEMYGMTENAATLTSNPLHQQKIGSVGIPLPGMEVKVVDEIGNELPPETVGEVIAKGPGIMKGYYQNTEKTREVLKDQWYYTSDMGWMDTEGFLYIVDRKDDMINAGAYKIYPREVEEVLYTHPSIMDCAVIGIPDERLGQIPVAHVVVKPDTNPTASEIIKFVKSKMANYKAPRNVFYHDFLPRSPQGKILKKDLGRHHVIREVT